MQRDGAIDGLGRGDGIGDRNAAAGIEGERVAGQQGVGCRRAAEDQSHDADRPAEIDAGVSAAGATKGGGRVITGNASAAPACWRRPSRAARAGVCRAERVAVDVI